MRWNIMARTDRSSFALSILEGGIIIPGVSLSLLRFFHDLRLSTFHHVIFAKNQIHNHLF